MLRYLAGARVIAGESLHSAFASVFAIVTECPPRVKMEQVDYEPRNHA